MVPGLPTRCQASDGQYHAEGETWLLDECTQCICHDGGVLCEIESCPPVLCHHPIKLPTMCCPVCPGNTDSSPVNIKVYLVQIVPYTRFWKPSPVARLSSCARFPQSELKMLFKRIPLIYVSDDGVILPPVKKHKMCTTSSGTKFTSGDSWRVNACQSCMCQDGQIHCFSQACPLLTCNRTILKKGQCCPYCAGS